MLQWQNPVPAGIFTVDKGLSSALQLFPAFLDDNPQRLSHLAL